MKRTVRSLLFIAIFCVAALTIVQLWNGIKWVAFEQSISQNKQDTSTLETQKLLKELEALIVELESCHSAPCLINNTRIEKTDQQLQAFTAIVSQEKSSINLVGATEYTKLKIALQKYRQSQNEDELLRAIAPVYIELQNTYRTLLQIRIQQINQAQGQKFKLSLWLFGGLVAIIFITIRLYDRRITQLSSNYNVENRQFDLFASHLNELSAGNLESRVSQLNLSGNERKIYSHLLELHKQAESEKQNADLYRQLYMLIGYEIRGITNTIEGGVKLLAQDSDESGAVMAKEITSATATLSELADNYNKLISQGTADSKNASLASLLSVLVVHIKAKAQRQQTQIECHIEDNLPNIINIGATSLFWVLFLQLSNAINLVKCKKILLHVYSLGAREIEKTRFTIDVLFLEHDNCTLNEIIQLPWQLSEEQHNSQDSWSKQILGNVSFFESSWFNYQKHQKKRVQIDVTPINFIQANGELKDKNILLCADSELQINIIQNLLERFKCQVTIARTPNDVFRNLPNLATTDAVIVTDTIEGIELRSFCKTLKSRMKKHPDTQLLLAISEAGAVQSVHEFVDGMFYTPLLPHEFIPNLVEAITQDKKQDEGEQNHFLIVEDDRVQQFLLKQLLKKQEHEASTAATGEEAVEYFKQNDVDIIFMDCIMPGMGGLNATKLIRSYERDNKTRAPVTIIGATALTSAGEHKACIEAGMDFVISKPYKSDEIAKVIKKYLAVHKIF